MPNQVLKEMLVATQAEKKTGKLVVIGKTGKNTRIGNLIFSDGELMNARYPGLSGNDAIKAILKMEISQIRFLAFPESPEPLQPGIFSISNIVTALSDHYVNRANGQSNPKQTISSDQKATLISISSYFIGPAAEAIVKGVLDEAYDIDSAISAVACEIPDKNQSVKFTEEVKRRLART